MVRGAVAKGVAACAVAALAAAGGARAQDAAAQAVSVDDIAAQIDFSTLASDPMQAITLLPMLGFSQQCQSDVIGAGANCLPSNIASATSTNTCNSTRWTNRKSL